MKLEKQRKLYFVGPKNLIILPWLKNVSDGNKKKVEFASIEP